MTKSFLPDSLAADMEKVLNSDENRSLFSRSTMLEKLAFSKEAGGMCKGKNCAKACELDGGCVCKESCTNGCSSDCACHPANADDGEVKTASSETDLVTSLLDISEELDELGLEKSAALVLNVTSHLIAEAKAKSSKKSKDSKKDSKKDPKKDSKKDMKDSKKSKDDKKDSKKEVKKDPKKDFKKTSK